VAKGAHGPIARREAACDLCNTGRNFAARTEPIEGGHAAFAAQVSGRTHNAGKNGMSSCHDHGFTFAGTITNAAGAAVAGAEVRLVDATGAAISVHTGTTGNFHSSTRFTAPAKVGVRDSTTVASMVTAIQAANGGCNACHAAGGTTTPIHLP
jgi:hypothetical protein